jgi:hypothetical protein
MQRRTIFSDIEVRIAFTGHCICPYSKSQQASNPINIPIAGKLRQQRSALREDNVYRLRLLILERSNRFLIALGTRTNQNIGTAKA